jgi:hypothetical protein
MHDKRLRTLDINWLFATPKLKKTPCSFWRNIFGAWLNVRVGLVKTEPASHVAVFRQPIFGNPFITNTTNKPLGARGLSEKNTIAKSGCTKLKDLWDLEDREWKTFPALRLNSHVFNKTSNEIITTSIPSNFASYSNRI